jgi:AraC family transcriptional activator of tynA and feaB
LPVPPGNSDRGEVAVHIKTFSTDGVPPRDRPRVWAQVIAEMAQVDFKTQPTGAKPLSASITSYVGRRLRFSAYTFSPHLTICTPRAGTRSGMGHFILAYLKDGSASIVQDGREASVRSGDIVLFDSARPLRIKAAMHCHSFDISAEQMKAVLPQVDGLTSIAFKRDCPAGSILRRVLDELFESGDRLNDEMSERIADAVPHLVAAALAALPETAQVAPGHAESHHLARIRNFVRDNLRRTDLSPESVARGVGLSTRHVHELFGKGPATLMRWIWVQRLERCRDELALPALRHRSVAEIAFSWGFSSQAHFSRVFRAQYAMSPREFRGQLH